MQIGMMMLVVLCIILICVRASLADVAEARKLSENGNIIYTFNIRGSQNDFCPQNVTTQSLASLRRDVMTQYMILEDKLDSLLEQFGGHVTRNVTPRSDPADTPPVAQRGVTYTTWGRTRCPNTSSLIYPGTADTL